MTLAERKPNWRFVVHEVGLQETSFRSPPGPHKRPAVGVLEPVGPIVIEQELNRPGNLSLPINPRELSPYLRDKLLNIGQNSLEIVCYWGDHSYRSVTSATGRPLVVFSGPIVGLEEETKTYLTVHAKSMLHYLDYMKVHYPYAPDQPEDIGFSMGQLLLQAQRLGTEPVQSGFRGPSDSGITLGSRLSGYYDWGIHLSQSRRFAGDNTMWQPGTGDEPAIDPRDGGSLLDVIIEYSDRGEAWGFDFWEYHHWEQDARYFSYIPYVFFGGLAEDTTSPFSSAPVPRKIGRDRRDFFVLQDEFLTNRVGSNLSLLPENFCNVVYALGGGNDAASVGSYDADTETYTPVDDNLGRHWHYAVATSSLSTMGMRIHNITSPATLDGNEDGTSSDSPEGASLQTVAEAYLSGRQEPFRVPDALEIEVNTSSSARTQPYRGWIAPHGTLEVGDQIGISVQTGFGTAADTSVRIKKKTLNIGTKVRMMLEFL